MRVGANLLTCLGANLEFYNVLKFECYTSTFGLIHNWMRKDISCSPTSLAWKHQREDYKLQKEIGLHCQHGGEILKRVRH